MMSKRMRLSSLANVTFSNILIFIGNIVVHFILPFILNIETYSYWQLHTLYVGYCCFALFGLNDGIHLLYSNIDYNSEYFPLFRRLRDVTIVMSIVSCVFMICMAYLFFDGIERFIVIVVALEIVPSCLNSVLSYINQGTLRFKEYAKGNVIEGIVLLVFIAILFLVNCRNIYVYILSAAMSKYIRLFYYFSVNREIMFGSVDHTGIIKEILNICSKGIMLTVCVTLNSSFLFATKIMLKEQLSIMDYGSYSFALNLLACVNILVVALSQVFYPILTRMNNAKFSELINALNEIVSLVGILLLSSYFITCLFIKYIYPQYISILRYLYIIFPLFIYTCKNNLVIINTFKVRMCQIAMLNTNLLAVCINIVMSFVALYYYKSMLIAAYASLLTYIIYYLYSFNWIIKKVDAAIRFEKYEFIYIAIFQLISYLCIIYDESFTITTMLIGMSVYLLLVFALLYYKKNGIIKYMNIIKG